VRDNETQTSGSIVPREYNVRLVFEMIRNDVDGAGCFAEPGIGQYSGDPLARNDG
jgi:hypothetical protein